jgi:GT2 family glycosyltransferase
MEANKPRIGIIYVPWKYTNYCQAIFAALAEQRSRAFDMHVYIVTNGEPETERHLNETIAPQFKEISYSILDDGGENLGFARAHNIAMKAALADGCSHVLLHNGDLTLEPNALHRLLEGIEGKDDVAAVQPLICYMNRPDIVNASGGVFHVCGYAFARDNLHERQPPYDPNIMYGSGAALLIRCDVLQEVGLLEEGFFMYHEDVEFGLRVRIAGYRIELVEEAVALHDYGFGRNVNMFEWIEQYRFMVIFAYYKLPTLLLLAPLLFLHDLAMWPLSALGGWLPAKWRACRGLFNLKSIRLIRAMRKRMHRLRRISDAELFTLISGSIEAQEKSNWIVERIGNPLIAGYLRLLKRLMIW